MERFQQDGVDIAYIDLDRRVCDDDPVIVWGHGWGLNAQSFLALAEAVPVKARHILVDFPGFGKSPRPFDAIEDSWGVYEYVQAMEVFISSIVGAGAHKVIWVGHSFGSRVGIALSAKRPDLIEAAVIIAGAGLKRKRTLWQEFVLQYKIRSYKMGKFVRQCLSGVSFLKPIFDRLEAGAGSPDYQNAGMMRGVLVRSVNQILSGDAEAILCPVLLVYGDKDDETPVEIGQRFHSLIERSQLVVLPDQDHYSLLAEQGRHQVLLHIKQFISSLEKME